MPKRDFVWEAELDDGRIICLDEGDEYETIPQIDLFEFRLRVKYSPWFIVRPVIGEFEVEGKTYQPSRRDGPFELVYYLQHRRTFAQGRGQIGHKRTWHLGIRDDADYIHYLKVWLEGGDARWSIA